MGDRAGAVSEEGETSRPSLASCLGGCRGTMGTPSASCRQLAKWLACCSGASSTRGTPNASLQQQQ